MFQFLCIEGHYSFHAMLSDARGDDMNYRDFLIPVWE